MEWLIAIAIAVPVWGAVIFAISRSKRSRRGKRRAGSGFSALEAGFSVFDPAKARAVQTIAVHREIGGAEDGDTEGGTGGDQGEPLDKAWQGRP